MSEDLRFFLAHDIRVPADRLNAWRDELTELMSEGYPDHMVTITLARDDFNANFSDAGGWRGWPRLVSSGKLWDGSPRFHGVIRPIAHNSDSALCGRATFDIVSGFVQDNKLAWLWHGDTLRVIESCERLPGDDYTTWGRLSAREE